jgi:uncharacterized protein (DUF952 family)
MNNKADNQIYLLSSRKDYEAAIDNGNLYRDSLDVEGFIHASPQNQLTRVANKYYKSVNDLLVVVLDVKKIKPEVKWEKAAGGLYPHIYGPLNMDSVVDVTPVSLDGNGEYDINFNS